MKLIRFGKAGEEKPGILDNGKWYDVSGFTPDYNESFFTTKTTKELQDWFNNNKASLPVTEPTGRLGSPFARPSKIICIGLNYADHAKETGAPMPPEPVIFMKASTALTGPFDEITIPKGSSKTDWEVELAIVIGKKASYVEEADALSYVAGYCLHNDVSEREFQLERNGTWDKGKGCDTFAPMGPWLVTPDEIAYTNNMRLWLKVNGNQVQDGNTSNLIFNIPHLISYTSQFMTLLPGDVISTGTPAGVGMGQKPTAWYLKEGDVIELGIDGLGEAKQTVRNYKG